MATFFLFAQHLTSESCLSLRIDDEGQLDAPLEQRTFGAIKTIQANVRTVVVLPTEHCSFHQIELPWLSDSKARAALPYALEEYVAQPVTTLHIAFDQAHYQNKQYLVLAIDSLYLQDLMVRLDDASLGFEVITVDWFALKADEAVVSETSLLVHEVVFLGALSAEPAKYFLNQGLLPQTLRVFNDSASEFKSNDLFQTVDSSFYEWTAQRLVTAKPMNLCQGALRHNTRQEVNRRWYHALAALVGLWIVNVFFMNALVSHHLTQQIAVLDEKIAVNYREFFPQARLVISPVFRVKQLLKEGRTGHDGTLWRLENTLATATAQGEFTIEQLRYQNQMLAVTLIAKDFAALDALQLRLQQAGVKVKQTQASSEAQHVTATLELRS